MPFARIDDDLDMFYRVDDFTDPWKTPETVVLHHGVGKDTRFWWGWVPVLARHYRVVRFDMRGFGQSSIPPAGYQWSIKHFARDMKLLLDHLGIDKAHLVGETVGGPIGMVFAAEYPDRTLSLSTCCSPYRFTSPMASIDGHLALDHGISAWVHERMKNRFDPSADPALSEWFTTELEKNSARVVGELCLQALVGVDLSDVLPQIKAPMLVITPDSGVVGLKEAREIQRMAPNCRVESLEGIRGHIQHSHPQRCAEACLKFLRSL